MMDSSRTIAGSALSSDNQQDFTVETLRGLAALSVTSFQLTNAYSLDWARYSGFHGWLGVQMFFVISGFIIPYSLHRSQYKTQYFPRFLLLWLVHLEPPYLVSVALVRILWKLALLVATIFRRYVEVLTKRASKRVALPAPLSSAASSLT